MRLTPARYTASDFVRVVGGMACAALLLLAGPLWMTSAAAQGPCADIQDNPGLMSDCEALLAIRDALGGNLARIAWATSIPITHWAGVTVDDTLGRVTKIRISPTLWYFHDLILDGHLPPEIGDLPYLTHLNMAEHYALKGPLPSELGNLTNLEVLDLRGDPSWLEPDSISGEIPPELGNLTNLRILRLNHNNFSGEIPTELADLPALEELRLGNNNFIGCLSEELLAVLDDANKVSLPYCNSNAGKIPRVDHVEIMFPWPQPSLEAGESVTLAGVITQIGSLEFACRFETKRPDETTWSYVESTCITTVTKHQPGIYLFRLRVTDEQGNIVYSDPVTYTWRGAGSPPETPSDVVAEMTIELGPGSPNQTVELAWDDGETVAIEIRAYDAKPSYVPSSIEVGDDVTYQINAWESNPRQAVFTRPEHGKIHITWSYAE